MAIDTGEIRDYQKEAFDTISNYIKDDTTESGCLIALPTGTGKTGVMAYTIKHFSDKRFLVIVPNATLPEQIEYEINTAFWQKIKSELPKADLSKLYDGNCETKKCSAIIMTIQKLLHVYKNNSSDFQKLSDWTDIVFYDEGHHEPSQIWAEASRQISQKTVLFTATPFRNDYRYFNISEAYYYEYLIKDAIDNKYIRSPRFNKIPNEIISNNKKLADFITKKTKHKSLVRISGVQKLETTKNQFENDIQVACCHSKFESKKDFYNCGKSFMKNQSSYKIVLQTDMLSEGVDIPDFTELFLIDCYDNFKSFAQIVGRVLRKNLLSDVANIYIPEDIFESFKEQWSLYLKRDSKTKYYNGKFLHEFSLVDTVNLYDEIIYEKQSSIYSSKEDIFEELKTAIIEKVKSSVEVDNNLVKDNLKSTKNAKLYTVCYTALTPSAHLAKKLIYDKHFEYISLVKIKDKDQFYYFYYSTQRLYPFENISGLFNIPMSELYCLFPKDADVKNVSFRSSHINKIGVSNYSFIGNSLNALPSSTEQRMSFFKNALATYDYNGSIVNRYISNFSSKVTDRNQRCDYYSYIKWCNSLIDVINSKKTNSYFERFAPITNPPSENIAFIAFDEMELDFDFIGCDVYRNIYPVDNNTFTVKTDSNEEIKGNILTSNDMIYIQFDSTNVSHEFYNKNKSLFNRTIKKGFVLYYIKSAVIYSNGDFYKPNIKYTYDHKEQCDLLNIMTPLDELTSCENEKIGTATPKSFSKKGFPLDSVFGVIIKELKSSKYHFEYIICDDLQCEIADLIAIDLITPKICFIHCKHGEGFLSASAFQDVCGQAIKNLNYVISSDVSQNDFIENHFDKWQKLWKFKDYETSREIKGDVKEGISKYKEIIGDLNVKKEVWIVTSGLSMESFCQELVKKHHEEQYIPLMNILHYTQDNVIKTGAALKIFCKK